MPHCAGLTLRAQAQWHDQVLATNINWESYTPAGLLTAEDVSLIRRYDKKAPEMQKTLIDKARICCTLPAQTL